MRRHSGLPEIRKEVLKMRESLATVVTLLSSKKIPVTMSGTMAYMQSDFDGNPLKINIPALPDNASDLVLDATRGFVDHEVAHVLFTDGKIRATIPEQLESWWNTVEDIYIERKMSECLAGSGFNLGRTRRHLVQSVFNRAYEDAVEQGMEGIELFIRVLAVPALRALSGQTEFSDWMKEGDKWQYIESVKTSLVSHRIPNMIMVADHTRDCIAIAKILAALLLEEKEKEKEKEEEESPPSDKPEKSPPSDKPDDEESGEDGSDPSEESDGDKSESDESGESDEEDHYKGSDESAPDESDKTPMESDAIADEGDDSDSDATDSDTDTDTDAEESPTSESAEDESDSEESAVPELTDANLEELEELGEPLSIEDALSESIKEGIEDTDPHSYRTLTTELDWMGKISEYPQAAACALCDGVYPEEHGTFAANRMRMCKADLEDKLARGVSSFGRWVEPLMAKNSTMAKDLERLILGRNKVQWMGGQKSGRVHGASLFKLKTGETDVFRKRVEHRSKNAAVLIVNDLSGSMSGERVQTAMASSYIIGDALDKCGIPNMITGFTTAGSLSASDLIDRMEKKGAVSDKVKGDLLETDGLNPRDEPLMLPIFKNWNQKTKAPEVVKGLGFAVNGFHLANNVDGESLMRLYPVLLSRPEEVLIMLVLSDGAPQAHGANQHAHLLEVTKFIETQTPIILIGVGIQTDTSDYYTNACRVDCTDELPDAVCQQIRSALL